jgi:hypothetical protein
MATFKHINDTVKQNNERVKRFNEKGKKEKAEIIKKQGQDHFNFKSANGILIDKDGNDIFTYPRDTNSPVQSKVLGRFRQEPETELIFYANKKKHNDIENESKYDTFKCDIDSDGNISNIQKYKGKGNWIDITEHDLTKNYKDFKMDSEELSLKHKGGKKTKRNKRNQSKKSKKTRKTRRTYSHKK